MKKLSVILLSILLSFNLISCGKSEEVKNVQKLISKIDSITLDTKDLIILAEDSYKSLPADEKLDVKNYDDLQSARLELDNIIKDFSDDEKYCARAIITLRNSLKDPSSLEVHSISFNNENPKYVEISSSAKNSFGALTRSTETITDDKSIITSGIPDKETYLYISVDTLDNSSTTINLDNVMLLVERYLDTKDKNFIGLDTENIASAEANVKDIENKIETIELVKTIQKKSLEAMDLLKDAANYTFLDSNIALTKQNEAIALFEEVKAIDLSSTSTELNTLKNNYTDSFINATNEFIKLSTAAQKYDSANVNKHLSSAQAYMDEARVYLLQFEELYNTTFNLK